MRKITFLLILVALCSGGNIHAQHSLLSTIYCAVLGDQDIRSEYKKLTHQALRDLGVENSKKVTVKQMNNVGPMFARVGLSSFTAFGIWFDESYLDQCSSAERVFQIYHEASHYACKHHQKIVGGTIVGSACLLSVFLAGLKQLDISTAKKYLTLTIANIVADVIYFHYLLPSVVKEQEKQADIMAACALIRTGKKHVVEDCIEQLKESAIDNKALSGGIRTLKESLIWKKRWLGRRKSFEFYQKIVS